MYSPQEILESTISEIFNNKGYTDCSNLIEEEKFYICKEEYIRMHNSKNNKVINFIIDNGIVVFHRNRLRNDRYKHISGWIDDIEQYDKYVLEYIGDTLLKNNFLRIIFTWNDYCLSIPSNNPNFYQFNIKDQEWKLDNIDYYKLLTP